MNKKKIVTIGGGTGSFTLLSGLKKYNVDISAIVSMADDGGSTGVLRDELGVLPPGDVRQCLVALSDSSEMLRKLMNYRFEEGGLKGHNFGNLFLSALEKINGKFSDGVMEAIKILNVKGAVIPVTDEDMRMAIELNNGEILYGEKQLDHNKSVRSVGMKKIFLESKVKANKKAVEAILKADAIAIGPGDLYGSVLPNLLVDGISEAIKRSKAKVIFNCNLTNKKGQTENYSIDDYVKVFEKFIGKGRIDFVLFNNKKISKNLVDKYEKREGKGLIVSFDRGNAKRTYKIVLADLVQKDEIKKNANDAIGWTRSFIRHDSNKLAKILMMVLELGEYESIIKEII